ncbi:metallophosphoesterase family protein [Methylobacterium radiodurans]|uniref:Metallophosphoesterase n=1 Tax=Methylobacterium radiodurans TaxID=2202828 RepID=A0A2U8VMU7_9HYPH|nr:metallophosphoesterase [Methylobacterium radiodurans]AWN34751.1 metallophosphoesterase [Methylobacterium radiodurans]
MSARDDILAFAHVGDLHLTGPNADNARDYRAIIAQLGATDGLDFVFLPGDNADNGLPEQYALARATLEGLSLPVHIITGDHDMEGGSLDAFYAGLSVPPLPYATVISGTRCLFLDMCGSGRGGPDFRLGAEQITWFERELAEAEAREEPCAIFMHSYPADLKAVGEAAHVADLIHRGPVCLVEMGHTHYNELANDGRTIYAACRSTGQIEEGPVGYAIAAINRGVVAWRFKELARPWPFVLITAPADKRLARSEEHRIAGETEVGALVLGHARVAACEYRIDDGPWRPMHRSGDDRRYHARIDWPIGARRLAVRARDDDGGIDEDVVEPADGDAVLATSRGIGSDADAIGAWPERGVLGTQLGPNRNGRHW